MFQPNSIRKLRDLRLQNQLERGDFEVDLNSSNVSIASSNASTVSSRVMSAVQRQEKDSQQVEENMNTNIDGVRETLRQMYQNPIQIMVQNKVLLKEVNQSIEDVQIWRKQEQIKLEQQLKENRQHTQQCQTIKSYLNDMEGEEEEDEEYLQKVEQCKKRLDKYRTALKLDANQKQYTQTQMSSEVKTDQVNQRLADSNEKLSMLSPDNMRLFSEYYNEDIAFQIEEEFKKIHLDQQLSKDLSNYDQLVDVLLEYGLPQSKVQVKAELTLDALKQHTSEIEVQRIQQLSQKEKINQDFQEFDQEMDEIDRMMADCGIVK